MVGILSPYLGGYVGEAVMGIREELLEAYDGSRAVLVSCRDSIKDPTAQFYEGELNGLLRALSILDKWELVAEHSIGSLELDTLHRIALTDNGDFVTDFVLKSGESIAIYRRA